ncbi:PAAR domain-containing protein [Sorangium sp. So ce542]|uniref:PAAR domain-containing protein n=1 Tax=Sorangium sp. So ce542 TaxID=3133316 RepID=UPI003F5E3DC1
MGQSAATKTSQVIATDTHIVMVPSAGGPIPTPLPHPFAGVVDGQTIDSVKIGGQPAAVVGSKATNQPPHVAAPPGTSFQKPPANSGEIVMGSATVKIGGKGAARNGDTVKTCNDPADLPVGQLVAVGTVKIG